MTALQTINEHHDLILDALRSYIEGQERDAREATNGRKGWSYYDNARLFLDYIEQHGLGLIDGLSDYETAIRAMDYASQTISVKLAAAKSLIKYAIDALKAQLTVEQRAGLYELLSDIKLPRLAESEVEIREDKYLTEAELWRFLDRCDDTTRYMADFMASTGVRVSEMLDIRLTDIQDGARVCKIRINGKGRKQRSVAYGTAKLEQTRQHFGGTTWLFEHDGRQYSRVSVTQRIRENGFRILGRRVGSHMFRHTYGTLKYKQDHDIVALSRALGHSGVSVTESMYIHHAYKLEDQPLTIPEDDPAVTEALERELNSQSLLDGLDVKEKV